MTTEQENVEASAASQPHSIAQTAIEWGTRKLCGPPAGKSYTWDFENRLVQAVVPGTGTTTFKYDPFGRRIQKSGPLGTMNYLYDGTDIVNETDNAGNIVAKYVDNDETVDEPLSELRFGVSNYYQEDGLGSVTSLSDLTGSLANTYTYDSFGKLTASTGTVINAFRYTAREADLETGLYYYRARYYDRAAGRFISEDTTGFHGGINFYSYVTNDPLNQTDPTGLDSDSQFCRRLREKIDNVRRNIQRRLGQLDEDPQGLPETCPGDKANPGLSRAGHRMLINMDKALLAALEGTYAARCKDGPPSPLIPVPVVTPEQQQQTVKALTWGTILVGGGYVVVEYAWPLLLL